MEEYKFSFNDKGYELVEENCDYLLNDEENPVTGIETSDVLDIMSKAETVNFELQYYDRPCENCLSGKAERAKYFKFLEYHFFIFTKEGSYVTNNAAREEGLKNLTFNQLLRQDIVDNSYIVSVMVCENCGKYSIEIEQCDI